MPPDAHPTDEPNVAEPKLEALASELSSLGSETVTERAVKRILPWVVSVVAHAGLLALGFLVTWTVVLLKTGEEPTLIVADFQAMEYDPLASLSFDPRQRTETFVQDRVQTDSMAEAEAQWELELEPINMLSAGASDAELARFAPDPRSATATFVGLSSTNARRIVYVIDASGSMIRSLAIVLEELARSLDALSPRQEFSVIFFRQNEALVVPPTDRLIDATNGEKARVLAWIDEHVIPSGRSSPVAALEKALSFKPDVIFLLSENITGSGEFEIDQTELLAMLEELNPLDPEHGRRATQINCVQFLDPDPLGTLERIAEAHGGPHGYKFLDREELGLRVP